MRGKNNFRHIFLFLGIPLCLYLLFAFPLVQRPLVSDETAVCEDSENPQVGLIGTWHPPLYSDTLRILVHFLGIKRENLRLFGIFCFALNLFLIYLISREISDKRSVSFWSCFLFATHPWAIQGSLILDIDNTILTVLLTLYVLYFIKNYKIFSLKNYFLSGLMLFLCLWAKLSTPLILLFSILAFYVLKGEIAKGLSYVFFVSLIGLGLFSVFWVAYSKFYNLPLSSIFVRSLKVLKLGPAGASLPMSSEVVLRFIRVSLWTGIYLSLLWLVIVITRIKDYFIRKKPLEIKDFLLIYTLLIFIAYIIIGGTSFGFAKHQYPLLPILSIAATDFVLKLKPKISKRQITLFVFFGLVFIFIERFFVGDLLYRINYLLRKITIFSPENIRYFFADFGWRIISYFIILAIGVLMIRLVSKKDGTPRVSIILFGVLILLANFSCNFWQLSSSYFTTYCYGRSIGDYRRLERLFKDILTKEPEALIIGPEDALFNAGGREHPRYNYSWLWNDRNGFLNAIKNKQVVCVSYGFSWNALFTYREIFHHPEVKKVLNEEYLFLPLGEYSVWFRK